MAEEISLARKYRPTRVSEYIGNESVKETVKRYLKGKKPQSILIEGNTGCGKTTIARLIIKEYLCDDRDPETGACCECTQCEAVDEYIRTGSTELLPDVYEVDIAESSGKKDMDYVLETVAYPAMNSWKVYLMDEYQCASVAAQSRILKILEEPPENVLFIFCTTNPEKIIETVKNRCQLRLKIKKPGMKELVNHLKKICLLEGRDYDVEGLRMLASRDDFVIRDAVTDLETVLNTRGNATSESVSTEFEEVSDNLLFKFFETFEEKDFLGYISLLYKIKVSYDFKQFLISLTNFTLRGIYILNGVDIEGLSDPEIKSYSKLFKRFSSQDISYILSSLKRMNVGDVEANLMSFIYYDREGNNKEEGKVVSETKSANLDASETSFRNKVLAKKEEAKLKEGASSIADKTKEVGLADMLGMFTLEKVK